VQTWDLIATETPGGSTSPVVLATADQARAVLIGLDAGQQLGDHEVTEGAWLLVLDGEVTFAGGDGAVEAGPGMLVRFEPKERHSVTSSGGARLLLFLAPWPGEGHFRGEEREL
jgi:quercetin dioxygenase-like cupin family protein